MSRWFRFYDRALDDPKVQRLAPDVFKGWVNLLCLASRNDGRLPGIADIAFALRITDREADSLIITLMGAGLLEDGPQGLTPHKWNELQFQGDKDPTNAERQRRFREKHRNETVTRYATVTSRPPEQNREDTETETEAEGALTRLSFSLVSIFPAEGTIEYTRWAVLARQHQPGADPDYMASEFRKFCRARSIALDGRTIEKTFVTFLQKQSRKATA